MAAEDVERLEAAAGDLPGELGYSRALPALALVAAVIATSPASRRGAQVPSTLGAVTVDRRHLFRRERRLGTALF